MSNLPPKVWVSTAAGQDFGVSHPMSPARIDFTMRLAQELGLLNLPQAWLEEPECASDLELELAHDADYIAAVREVSAGGTPQPLRGLGTEDVPVSGEMHEPAARIAGGTLRATDVVWRGLARRAVNLSGGMHHARRDAASGFCVYNDAAVGIAHLLEQGAKRVAYIDIDAHHGDGVEAIFWDDPRVLTVSVHQSPATIYPGTGYPTDVGGPQALGTAVNVALAPGTDGGGWLRAVEAVIPDVLRAFEPQIIISQHGCDSHGHDGLSDLEVDLAAQRAAAELIRALSQELCQGRWVALGGGGYNIVDVVPRAWVNLLALALDADLAPDLELPQSWREYVLQASDRPAPHRMDEGEGDIRSRQLRPWSAGFDPDSDLDRAVRATRQAVMPLLGVDLSGEI